MKSIKENKVELYLFYRSYFANFDENLVRKDFEAVIRMRLECMPYFFAKYLIEQNYDINL